MKAVELLEVKKNYGDVEVFGGVDLVVEEGEFVVFVGPSGSGKSTLLRMIAGLEAVTDGEVRIGGEDVTFAEPSERGIAMVFQSYALYPHMNVYNNIAFNLRLSRLPKADVDKRVKEAARILRLEDLLDRSPAQLSGGERQRVAIGRAIVRKPKVFLFDEPLSNLDAALRVQMRLEIERLHRDLGATMIYVTHDQIEAMTLADRIVVIDNGELQQIGKPLELYARPANRFVAGFIGSPKMNFLFAEVTSHANETAKIALNVDTSVQLTLLHTSLTAKEKITVGIRPEFVSVLTSPPKPDDQSIFIKGRVETVERLGNINYGYFDIDEEELITVQIMGNTELETDQKIYLELPRENLHIFDQEGHSISASTRP